MRIPSRRSDSQLFQRGQVISATASVVEDRVLPIEEGVPVEHLHRGRKASAPKSRSMTVNQSLIVIFNVYSCLQHVAANTQPSGAKRLAPLYDRADRAG